MSQHRIEIICKVPRGKLETITVTVAANASPDQVAKLTKQLRVVIEAALEPGEPLTIEHVRDYPIRAEEKP